MKGFLAAVLAYAAIIVPMPMPEAKAMTCTSAEDVSMCMDWRYTDSNGHDVWNVVITNQYTTERINVTCDGSYMVRWNSQGGGTQEQVHDLAVAFCAL